MTIRLALMLALVAIASCGRDDAPNEPAPETEGAVLASQAAAAAEENDTPPAPSDIPDTDIYVAPLSIRDGAVSMGAPINVTNQQGYDNQPYFLPTENAFLFASEGATGKTDIWRYDIETGGKVKITDTPDVSEYSPRMAPHVDGLSFIQEDAAGEMTRVHLKTADAEGPALDLGPVGYYAWAADGSSIAVFYRSDPGSLHAANLETGETSLVQDDIGRALYPAPDGRSVFFTRPRGEEGFSVFRYAFDDGEVTALFDLPGEAEDYAVIRPSGDDAAIGMLSAEGATVFFRPGAAADVDWVEIADYESNGLAEITRLSVNADRTWVAFAAARQTD